MFEGLPGALVFLLFHIYLSILFANTKPTIFLIRPRYETFRLVVQVCLLCRFSLFPLGVGVCDLVRADHRLAVFLLRDSTHLMSLAIDFLFHSGYSFAMVVDILFLCCCYHGRDHNGCGELGNDHGCGLASNYVHGVCVRLRLCVGVLVAHFLCSTNVRFPHLRLPIDVCVCVRLRRVCSC